MDLKALYDLAGEFTPDEDDYLDDGEEVDREDPEATDEDAEGQEPDLDADDDGEESEGRRPAKKEAAPQYVTREEHQQQLTILNNLAASIQGLAQGFNATARQRQAAPEEKDIPEVTDEEWEEADGDPKAMRRLFKQERDRERQIHRRELAQVANDGFQAISGLMKDKLSGLEFYPTYKAEVDAMIAELPERAQLNPQVIEACYNQVVARHLTEIRENDRKAAARQKAIGTKTSVPSGRNGRSLRRDDEDEDDDYDDDALDTLEALGWTKDEFAQSLGYKDDKDYRRAGKPRKGGRK